MQGDSLVVSYRRDMIVIRPPLMVPDGMMAGSLGQIYMSLIAALREIP